MKILLIKDNNAQFISREQLHDLSFYGIDIKTVDGYLINTVIPGFIYNLFKSNNKFKIKLALNLSCNLKLITKSI